MGRLVYVRHGETHHNRVRLFSGRSEAELTREGVQAAVDVVSRINIVPDFVMSSPRERARRTAQIVTHGLGIGCYELIVNHLLDERSFGQLEGRSSVDFPDELDPLTQLKMLEMGAESLHDVYARAQKFLSGLEHGRYEKCNLLVFGHASFGRALIRAANRLPFDAEVVSIPNTIPIEIPLSNLQKTPPL
jgi:broad specificity phosphatase PhoE